MAVITVQVLGSNPNGVRVVEYANWKGSTFVIPRSSLGELNGHNDLRSPGIYFLIGEGVNKPTLYIGQSDDCYGRLTTHDRTKDDDAWNTAIVFTGGLHSTYVKYLEGVSIRLARKADRYQLLNRTEPTETALTPAQKETADEFLEKISFLTEFFGYKFFQTIEDSLISTQKYYLESECANATAQLLDDGSLNVLLGSTARVRETESFGGWAKAEREKLLTDETLILTDNLNSYKFTKDVLFKSPTAAAATITGRSINGWTAWKDENGKTLDENLRG